MTEVNPIYLAFFIVYLVVVLGIGLWAFTRTRNVMDFWVFGQDMSPLLATWSLIANTVSAVSVIGFVGAVYAGGYALMSHTILGLILGLTGLYFVVGFIRRLDILTFPDLVARVTGSQVARPLAGGILLLSSFLYLIMQLVGSGLLVTAITGVPYEYMVWVIGVVFIAYTVLGGLVSVAWTDLLQGILMVGAILIAFTYMMLDLGGLTEANLRLGAIDPALVDPTQGGQFTYLMIAGMFVAFFGTLFTEQDMLIRIAATRNVRTAKIHIAVGALVLAVFYSILVLLGGATRVALTAEGIVLGTPDAALPTLITSYVSTFIGVIVILAVMSAILSTTDTRLHAIGMTVARDMYSFARPNASDDELMRVSRTATLILGLLATAAAVDPPGTIITLYGFRAIILTSAFFVPVYLALFWKGFDGRVVLAAIAGGALLGLGAQLMGGTIGPIPATFVGVGGATLILLLGRLATGRQDPPTGDRLPEPPRSAVAS